MPLRDVAKRIASAIVLTILIAPILYAAEDERSQDKSNLEIVAIPMVAFNPNFGNGGGVSAMALFDLGSEDEDLPTSSVGVSGIYTDRGSHFVGRFFPHPRWRLKGGAGNIAVKNELDIPVACTARSQGWFIPIRSATSWTIMSSRDF